MGSLRKLLKGHHNTLEQTGYNKGTHHSPLWVLEALCGFDGTKIRGGFGKARLAQITLFLLQQQSQHWKMVSNLIEKWAWGKDRIFHKHARFLCDQLQTTGKIGIAVRLIHDLPVLR